MIFENLEEVASTCLGLTSKLLYPIHRSLYGTVELSCIHEHYDGRLPNFLHDYLHDWMAPKYVWHSRWSYWYNNDCEPAFLSKELLEYYLECEREEGMEPEPELQLG